MRNNIWSRKVVTFLMDRDVAPITVVANEPITAVAYKPITAVANKPITAVENKPITTRR